MSPNRQVLVVEDNVKSAKWLFDLIRIQGYEIVLATNEKSARERFDAVKAGEEVYKLAFVDVMMATVDLLELEGIDDQFLEDSIDSGIRLCEHARRTLALTEKDLYIVCLTAREDDEVVQKLDPLGIRVFRRADPGDQDELRELVYERLPLIREAVEEKGQREN